METISFEDFKKAELRVAKILTAEKIEGSDKLIKLKIDIGEERQILAGIGKAYAPDDLVGREIVVVANLEPRSLMGEESQGMLLAAVSEEGDPILIAPDKNAPAGAEVR